MSEEKVSEHITIEPKPRAGWQLENKTGIWPGYWAMRDDQSESFRLTDREFKMIDESMSYKLLATILCKIKERKGEPVRIIDIGGGVKSECLRGMLRHPNLANHIQCTNIDPFAHEFADEDLEDEGIAPRKLTIIKDEFEEANIPAESADIIFSYEVVNHLAVKKRPAFFDKIGKILAPNGEAHIKAQDLVPSSIFNRWAIVPGIPMDDDHWLVQLANRHRLYVTPSFGETTLDGRTHIMGSPLGFLYMSKWKDEDRAGPTGTDFNNAFPEIREAVKNYR